MVWVGGALDLDRDALAFRERLGLGDMTCVKFNPDRHHLHLYAPERLPLPNTPEYKAALLRELHELIRIGSSADTAAGLITIIIGDVPLRAIVAAQLAADFGSRVRVEQTDLAENGILISGWSFWRDHQGELPTSKLLAIATLPFPSLEDPYVAAEVAHYKQQRQDWFRLYLLPTALRELQRAIAPIREVQGTVILLDVRAIYRSYGKQFFAALSPYARVSSAEVGRLDA
jgi:ATP-dependent DNA helicase DinG